MIYDLANAKADHPKWFERGAMRFFGTRLHEQRVLDGAVYVVTSEQPPHSERTWNVRRFDREYSDTLGPEISTGFGSHARALEVAGLLAAAERAGTLKRRERSGDEFVPCALCRSEGKQYPAWAQYLAVTPGEDEWTHVCSEHVPGYVERAGVPI